MKLEIDSKEAVLGMRSAENELITFKQCTIKGEIEEWLAIIEEAMKLSVKYNRKKKKLYIYIYIYTYLLNYH